MKKPFLETKVGKLLSTGVAKGLIKSIPFVGDIAGNILESNNAPAGAVDRQELPTQLVRLTLVGLLVLAALKGWISFEEVEQAKDVLAPMP